MKTFFITSLMLCMVLMTYAQDKPKTTIAKKTTVATAINKTYNSGIDFENAAMNKGELIDAIAKDAGFTKADAGNALNAFSNSITKFLKKGEAIEIPGLGIFYVENSPAHEYRDSKTGNIVKIKAKKVVKFKAGKALSDTVN